MAPSPVVPYAYGHGDNLAPFMGGVSTSVYRTGDDDLSREMYPLFARLMAMDNLRDVAESVLREWDVKIPLEKVASVAREVYSERSDATFLERRAVHLRDTSHLAELLRSLNQDVRRRLGTAASVWSNSEDYERYARVFLGDEQPNNAAIPWWEFTSSNPRKDALYHTDNILV
eukprot:jgi/Mesvir1/11374/Mv10274-RA.1